MSIINFNKYNGKSSILTDSINNTNINQIEEEMKEFKDNLDYYLRTQNKESLKHTNSKDYFIYWDYKDAKKLKNNLKKIYYLFKKNINLIKESKSLKILEFIEFYEDFENEISIINNNYVKDEIDRNKEFFDKLNLNKGQREAVVVDEDCTQIIAGAGTGKTRTLISNVKYLIEKKNVDPSKILCLSYSRESTEDLRRRIKNMGILASKQQEKNKVRVATFHSFGLSVIPYDFDKGALKNIFKNYVKKVILDDITIYELFKLHYFNDLENSGFTTEDTKGIAVKYKNSEYNYRTFDGKSVMKTFPELKIADFLILNGIKFEYEKEYPIEYKDNLKVLCDFYLPDYNIYIEDYRLTGKNSANWLKNDEEKEYLKQMDFKLGLKNHKKMQNSEIITVNSFNYNFLENLEEELKKLNIKFRHISKFDKEKMLEKNQILFDFKNKLEETIEEFIKSFKEHHYSNKKIHEFEGEDEREKFLLNFIANYYDYYQEYLNKNNLIDYSDMILKSIHLIKNVDYDYIFVDEYQDISEIRFELLKKIKEKSKAKLVVVGDDWQSIFGFNGCDVKYFTNFKNYFPHYKEVYLNRTYRSPNQLINVAGNFVDDKHLITKELYCEKSIAKPIKLWLHSNKQAELVYSILEEISENAKKQEISENKELISENRNVMILSRYNDDLDNIKGKLNSICASENLKLNIEYNTIHKSKGLESENVIIIGVDDDTNGIPSKKETTGILRFVSFSNDAKKQELEERRLFYVGLTRTKNNVYLCAKNNRQSKYISELNKNQIEIDKFNPPNSFNPFTKNVRIIIKQFGKYKKLIKETGLKCRSCGKGDINIYEINGKNYVICSENNGETCNWTIDTKVGDIDRFSIEYCPKCSKGIVYKKENKKNKKTKIKCSNQMCNQTNYQQVKRERKTSLNRKPTNDNPIKEPLEVNKTTTKTLRKYNKKPIQKSKDMSKFNKKPIQKSKDMSKFNKKSKNITPKTSTTKRELLTQDINPKNDLKITETMRNKATKTPDHRLNKDQKFALTQLETNMFIGDTFRSSFRKQLKKYNLSEKDGLNIREDMIVLIKLNIVKRNEVRKKYIELMQNYSKK